MYVSKIKIDEYIFAKEEDGWHCKNHNLMSGDMQYLSEIMLKIEEIEKILLNDEERNAKNKTQGDSR